jgi:FkbM family methyltransferase
MKLFEKIKKSVKSLTYRQLSLFPKSVSDTSELNQQVAQGLDGITKEFFQKKISKDDIVIDCGAHIGQETVFFGRLGATVYAFEPGSFAFKKLQENLAKYSLNNNCYIYNAAVGTTNTKAKLFLKKQNEQFPESETISTYSSSLISEKVNVDLANFEEVNVIDIVEFINGIGKKVKLLKMDVEGSEYDILKKIIDTKIYEQIDYIAVETHADRIPSFQLKHDEIVSLINEKKITNIYLNWA